VRSERRRVLAWALYDWANSAFATTVMAGFFPVFFKQYWSTGVDVTESTLRLGLANSAGSLVLAVAAPFLGAMADRGGVRKRFLAFFAFLGAVNTCGLFLVAQGQWVAASILYIVASVGFAGGNIFYDALLVDVTTPERSDRVSALGYALGYLGGGLLFAVNVLMSLKPAWFGLADTAQAVRISFVTVGVWWAVFSIPLFLWVRERPAKGRPAKGLEMVGSGWRQLRDTFRQVRRLRMVALFLIAYWLYIDGVDTIVKMAVDYGLSLGFDSNQLVAALLLVQFVAFPAALGFGWIGQRLGTKTGIYLAIVVYLGVTVWGYLMDRPWEFWVMAVVIGLVQGGIQSLSRSFYSRIIPPSKSAEFFGFFNMLGKFAAVVGPVIMGWAAVLTGNPRSGILALAVLFLLGGAILTRVDEEKGRQMAALLDAAG
jgi:MFS transporter, UMF1 family